MIQKQHRFHRRNQVQYVHRRGVSVRGNNMSLRYVERPDTHGYRLAVVVSKKVDKRAVTRNRIRRRVYAYIRNLEPSFRDNLDIVISVFDSKLASSAAAEFKEELNELINRSKLQK